MIIWFLFTLVVLGLWLLATNVIAVATRKRRQRENHQELDFEIRRFLDGEGTAGWS
jgi:hypothetical protein